MRSLSDEAALAQTRAAIASPFRTGKPAPVPTDVVSWDQIPGWFSHGDAAALRELLGSIPEGGATAHIGIFGGRHLAAVADVLAERSLSVVAIDSFAGTPNAQQGESSNWEGVRRDAVYFISTFLGERGIGTRLYQTTSHNATLAFSLLGERFDLIFIDADHSYEAIALDIALWRQLLCGPDSILCGHDYTDPAWPGVRRAVDELCPGAKVMPDSSIWWTVGARE